MQLSLDHFAIDQATYSSLCDFRDWLKDEDTVDGESYDEARMLCRDLGDYLSGKWKATPERAFEVIVSRMHDLVFALQRHGFYTAAGVYAEQKLRLLANSFVVDRTTERPN